MDAMDHDDPVLERMLRDRRAPLTQDAMNRLLSDLTLYLAGDVNYIAAFFPHKNAADKSEIRVNELQRTDIMEGTDGENYLPVFTDIRRFKKWKSNLRKGEYIYVLDKQDILRFLNANPKIAAAVINPMEDDLLLYRMQLRNMIRIDADRKGLL